MPEKEASGPTNPNVWVASRLPEKIIEFCRRLETEPEKVDTLEIGLFISQFFRGEAESDAWLRHLNRLRTEPYQDYRDMGPDGKMHRYRMDWTFRNPAVRDVFFKTLFNELRKKFLALDAISQLAYMIGTWRAGGEPEKRGLRPKGGGPAQL